MSELPASWATATISEVTQTVNTLNPRTNPNAEFTYVDISSVDSSAQAITAPKLLQGSEAPSRARQLLRSGDTVFSTVRPYLRNIGYVDDALDGSLGSTGFAVLRPAPGLNSRYLFYHCLTNRFVDGLTAVMRGTSYPAVIDSQVGEMQIAVAPTAEQERIVAVIEEQLPRLDAGVTALKRAEHNIKRMRSTILQAATTGQLLGVSADGWESATLGELLESIEAGRSFKCEERPAGLNEWGVIKVSAMTWGTFRQEENKTVLAGRDIDRRMEIRSGDLLVSRANTLDHVGAVVHVRECRPRLLLSDKSLRLKPGPRILPEWLLVVLRSRFGRRYIESVATGTSDSMRNISQQKLRALIVPVPPIPIQRELTEDVERRFSLLNDAEAAVAAKLRHSRSLRAAILATAFSGKLVPQNPADEPAPALLERITAERRSSDGHESIRHRRRKVAT